MKILKYLVNDLECSTQEFFLSFPEGSKFLEFKDCGFGVGYFIFFLTDKIETQKIFFQRIRTDDNIPTHVTPDQYVGSLLRNGHGCHFLILFEIWMFGHVETVPRLISRFQVV